MIGRICAVNMLFGCNHTVLANACEILEVMEGGVNTARCYTAVCYIMPQCQVKFTFSEFAIIQL